MLCQCCDIHFLVAGVIKSFDAVDWCILYLVLGRLGLPATFGSFVLQYRLQFRWVAGWGVACARDGERGVSFRESRQHDFCCFHRLSRRVDRSGEEHTIISSPTPIFPLYALNPHVALVGA